MTNIFTEEMWLCDIAHSIVGDLGGSDSSSNQQSQQSFANNSTGNQSGQYANGPINSQQLQDALTAGRNIYGQNAGFANQLQSNGLGNIQSAADRTNQFYGAADGQQAATLNGSYLSAGNPYFQGMVGQLGQAIRPQIDGQFESAGRYGSGANANAFASALTNQAGQLAFQNYGQERGNMLGAAAGLPAYTAGMYQPGQAQLTAGYAPFNQYISQLSQLKPGVAGSYGQMANNTGTSNGNSNGSGDQSQFNYKV